MSEPFVELMHADLERLVAIGHRHAALVAALEALVAKLRTDADDARQRGYDETGTTMDVNANEIDALLREHREGR